MATTEISSGHLPPGKKRLPKPFASDAIREREIRPRANNSHLHPARAQTRQGWLPGRVGSWNQYSLVPSHKRLFGSYVQSTPWVHTRDLQGSIPGAGKHEKKLQCFSVGCTVASSLLPGKVRRDPRCTKGLETSNKRVGKPLQ